jgi:pimeloyl-ACP methyl ester carboxylesterase
MAESPEEIQRRRRRQRLVRGLLVGGAAIGVPALFNLIIAKRAQRLPDATWGSGDVFAWKGGEVSYQRLGRGLPVVLLHSFGPGHSSAEWRLVAGMLADSCEVFALELPGWGLSSAFEPPFDDELYVELLRDFLLEVVEKRALVVAAGLAAAYAVQVAADHPELFGALGLVVPHGLEHHADEPDIKDAVLHRVLRLPVLGTSALNVYTSKHGIASYLRREVFHSAAMVDEHVIDLHYLNSHRPGARAALAALLAGYLNHGVRGLLARLRLPVWLAWGRQAQNPRVEAADFWLKRIPAAELEIFEHAGILPHAESPGEFCRKLEKFIDSLDTGDEH